MEYNECDSWQAERAARQADFEALVGKHIEVTEYGGVLHRGVLVSVDDRRWTLQSDFDGQGVYSESFSVLHNPPREIAS